MNPLRRLAAVVLLLAVVSPAGAAVPPKKNVAYTFYAALVDQTTGQYRSTPTINAGDCKVSIDGGSFANLATLPDVTPAASRSVRFQLSAGEMNGDQVLVMCAGSAQWNDVGFLLSTSTVTLADIDSGSDPLLNQVPGTYAAGTAGAILGRIGSAQVTTVSPVSVDGTKLTLVRGDDYFAADARSLDFTDVSAAWPDLTGASVAVTISGIVTSQAGTVVTPSGASKKVRFELAGSTTSAKTPGSYSFDVQATLTSGRKVTLVRGTVSLVIDYTP
jgi:hypothetical protein